MQRKLFWGFRNWLNHGLSGLHTVDLDGTLVVPESRARHAQWYFVEVDVVGMHGSRTALELEEDDSYIV